MFKPVSIFIGLRYTRAKRRNHFISFISLASMLSIALGITVLITVLSVMNGFDAQIKDRIFELAPQVSIKSFNGQIQDWSKLQAQLAKLPDVMATMPFVDGQGMLTKSGTVHAVMISGVNPKDEARISKIATKMTSGSLKALTPGSFGIVLGQVLASNLGVTVGDKVTLVTPEASVNPAGIMPRFKRFTVVGIFDAGSGFGFDSTFALINLKDAQVLYQMGSSVSGIRLKLQDLYQAPKVSQLAADQITSNYYVTNWTMTYGPLFKAIQMEKTMMFLILLLIIGIAAFNLVVTLVMVVTEKQADIAILRTLGATPKSIMAIFITQGFVVGIIGTLLGIIGGVSLALNVTPIVNLIERTFHVQFLSSSVYYVSFLPSKLESIDVIHVCIAAFVLSLLATIYPAWRASRVQPAEALRYE